MQALDATVLTNARIALADQVLEGAVELAGGVVTGIGAASKRGADLNGDCLIPGLAEPHMDHLETQHAPRPKVRWHPAVRAHNASKVYYLGKRKMGDAALAELIVRRTYESGIYSEKRSKALAELMRGTFVAVVGSSGAGKDSVMAYARDRLGGDVVIVRRVVTRHADDGSEDHETMTMEQFAAAETEGRFALSWPAHGLRYGLPVELEDDLHEGRVVIANLSRAVIPQLMARYPAALVVEVTADPQVIAARLAGRGREDAEEIRRRMDRSIGVSLPASTVRLDNSGRLAVAGEQFVSLLRDLLRLPAGD